MILVERDIKKYISETYTEVKEHFFKSALAKGLETGAFAVHHNHKGSYKPVAAKKPAAKAPASKPKKKPAAKKPTKKKKKAAPKKKKPTKKKAAPKKKKKKPAAKKKSKVSTVLLCRTLALPNITVLAY